MADGNLVRQQGNGKGAMVFGPSVYDVPLLPYEKQLIKTIGITEDEYRLFAAEVRHKGRLRPAEYEHIPDIVNEPVTAALISIAVSLVLTGVSYLLTPKPKMPAAPKQEGNADGGDLRLSDVAGQQRFTPTRGFETLNELANYGAPVPIIFGRYDSRTNDGGIFVTPRLVWSRMFSYGSQQSARLMFVVGEQGRTKLFGRDSNKPEGVEPPVLEGVFLGNNALDVIYENSFAFYWKEGSFYSGRFRIRANDMQFGSRGGLETGDPTLLTSDSEDAFLCPTDQSDNDTGFSHAYSPGNNTEFGVYAPIANGNGYRLNYRVVSIDLRDEASSDQRDAATVARIKIIGDDNKTKESGYKGHIRDGGEYLESVRDKGPVGSGRQYSPRMGIVKLIKRNGNKVTVDDESSTALSTVVGVNKDDKIEFIISDTKIEEDFYELEGSLGESVDDINSSVQSAQLAADEAMQVGEIFAIANTYWVVVNRKLARFDIDASPSRQQEITLKCIDESESSFGLIGLVSKKRVVEVKGYIDDRGGVGAGFFPITKVAVASFRHNRPTSVTEIGIKSTVYQRLNGLCAFNSLPSDSNQLDLDKRGINVTSGTITSTIARSSVFIVFVRQAGRDESATPFEFEKISIHFVVTGYKPTAQFNFIRIFSPEKLAKTELEYKIVPVPASELRDRPNKFKLIRLAATDDLLTVETQVGAMGTFKVQVAGSEVEKSEIILNKEFTRAPSQTKPEKVQTIPDRVVRDREVPNSAQGTYIDDIEFIENRSNLSNATAGRNGAMTWAIAGNTDKYRGGQGALFTKETTEYLTASKWIKVRWTLRKNFLADGHYAKERNGQNVVLQPISAVVIASSGNFDKDYTFTIKRGLGGTDVPGGNTNAYNNSNPFHKNHPNGNLKWSGQKFKVKSVERGQATGRAQSYYYEIFGDASSFDLGRGKVTELQLTESRNRKIKLSLKSKVIRIEDNRSGQSKGWSAPSITVVDDINTNQNWEKGDIFTHKQSISQENPFRSIYPQTGFVYEVKNLKTETRPGKISAKKVYEGQSQIADISFYRDFVDKSNASSPEHQIVYVNEIVANKELPEYNNLTIAGLSLRATRNFTRLDQMRCWLPNGLFVRRLHPDATADTENPYGDSSSLTYRKKEGPSNLFTDLVYYLLTDQMAGAGALLNMSEDKDRLVDINDLKETSKFLYKQKLFFNGAITDRSNLRQFITDVAPYFLCNFVITDGKFSLKPAIPHNPESGDINRGPVAISQLFTGGNILEDTFKVEYLSSEERRPFKAVVRYRQESRNQFPQEKVVEVKLGDDLEENNLENLPNEAFDLTQFCTSKAHAVKVAKYFLGLRRLVTHTISFSTTLDGLNIQAGSYIKVVTETSPYSSANNGTIDSQGNITSVKAIEDGQYKISYFKENSEEVQDGKVTVSDNKISNSKFHSSIFSIVDTSVSADIYIVEQLTFSQEGTVDIVASQHPCDDGDRSELARLMLFGNFNVQSS